MKFRVILVFLLLFGASRAAHTQELNAKITINHNQIQGTDVSVFENLEQTIGICRTEDAHALQKYVR